MGSPAFNSNGNDDGAVYRESQSVVLVSFLRDWNFWRDATKKLRCDLPKQCKENRLIFIDGLSELFNPAQNLPSVPIMFENGRAVLATPDLHSVQDAVTNAINATKVGKPDKKVLLILDGLDILLAAMQLNVEALLDVISYWRENVHATIIASSADKPLLQRGQSPLESSHAAFTTSLAHQANTQMSLRLLSTGAAKDVSGVLRITKGPVGSEDGKEHPAENELLYFIGSDGYAKVFERGSG